jgi:hypothetical protein
MHKGMRNASKVYSKNVKERGHLCSENDIKTYLKEVGCKGVDWIHLAQNEFQYQTLMCTHFGPYEKGIL